MRACVRVCVCVCVCEREREREIRCKQKQERKLYSSYTVINILKLLNAKSTLFSVRYKDFKTEQKGQDASWHENVENVQIPPSVCFALFGLSVFMHKDCTLPIRAPRGTAMFAVSSPIKSTNRFDCDMFDIFATHAGLYDVT